MIIFSKSHVTKNGNYNFVDLFTQLHQKSANLLCVRLHYVHITSCMTVLRRKSHSSNARSFQGNDEHVLEIRIKYPK